MYVFSTRLPVASNCIATVLLPLDLHVLSLPLAFILSQDQTLHCKKKFVPFDKPTSYEIGIKICYKSSFHFLNYLKDVMSVYIL